MACTVPFRLLIRDSGMSLGYPVLLRAVDGLIRITLYVF